MNTSTSNLSTSNLSQSNLSTSQLSEIITPSSCSSSHNYRFKNKFKSKHRNNKSSSRGVTISPEKNIITIKPPGDNERVPKRQISHSFHNLSSSKESLFQKFKPQNPSSSSSMKLSRPKSFLDESSNTNNDNREDIEEIYQTITSISQNKARQVQSQFKRRLAPPLHISNPQINHELIHDSTDNNPKGILKSNNHLAQVNSIKHQPPILINSVDPRILPDPRISTSSTNLTENSKSLLLSEDDEDDDEEGETTTIYDSTSNVVIKVTQAKMKRVTLQKKSSFTDKSKLDRKHKKTAKRDKDHKVSRSSPNLYKNSVGSVQLHKSSEAAVVKHNNVVIKHSDDAVVKPNLKNSQNPRRSDSGASSIDKTTTCTSSDKTSSTGSLLDDGSYRSRDKNNNNSDSGANSDFDASTFDKYKNDAKFYYQNNNNNTFETNAPQHHHQLYFDKISHPSSLQKSYSTTTAPPSAFSKKFVITPEMLQNIQQQQQHPKKL